MKELENIDRSLLEISDESKINEEILKKVSNDKDSGETSNNSSTTSKKSGNVFSNMFDAAADALSARDYKVSVSHGQSGTNVSVDILSRDK